MAVQATGLSAGAKLGFSNTSVASAPLQGKADNVPDWLKDLAEPAGPPRELLGRKVLHMPDAYIKSLIGRGGETIRAIINKTGADIQIQQHPENKDGVVSIANHIDKAIGVIREVLMSRGCHWETEETTDHSGPVTKVGWKGAAADDDVLIPTELVGLFIGNAGAGIKEIKAKLPGGGVTIKVLPPGGHQGGFQVIQVVGDNWRIAKHLVRQKVKAIMEVTPGRWQTQDFSYANAKVQIPSATGAIPAGTDGFNGGQTPSQANSGGWNGGPPSKGQSKGGNGWNGGPQNHAQAVSGGPQPRKWNPEVGAFV